MKKSKFLKKSLAMLLALMLVVAMIPLSASAALPEGFDLSSIVLSETSNRNGGKIVDLGTGVNVKVSEKSDNIWLFTNEALPTGAELRAKGATSTVKEAEITKDGVQLPLKDYMNSENVIELNLYDTTVSLNHVSATYTIKLEQVAGSTNTNIASVTAGKGIYSATVDNVNKQIKVVTARHTSNNPSDKWTENITQNALNAQITVKTEDPTATVSVESIPADNGDTFTVTSGSKTVTTEYTVVVTEYVDAFTSFSVNGVAGVFSDANKDGVDDTITVSLPKSAIRNAHGDLVPSPSYKVEYAAYGNTSPSVVINAGATKPDGTALGDVATGTTVKFTDFGNKANAGGVWNNTITVTRLNNQAAYGAQQTYNLVLQLEKSENTAITHVQMDNTIGEVDGDKITAELPVYKTIGGGNRDKTDPANVTVKLYTDKTVSKIIVNGAEQDEKNVGVTEIEWVFNKVNLDAERIVTVYAEDSNKTQQYKISATIATNQTDATITGFKMVKGTTEADVEFTGKNEITVTVPYMTFGVQDWKIYATPSSGAKVQIGESNDNDPVDHGDWWDLVNGQTTGADIGGFNRNIADGNDKLTQTFRAVNKNNESIWTEYKVIVKLADPASADVALTDLEFTAQNNLNDQSAFRAITDENTFDANVQTNTDLTNSTVTALVPPSLTTASDVADHEYFQNIVTSYKVKNNGVVFVSGNGYIYNLISVLDNDVDGTNLNASVIGSDNLYYGNTRGQAFTGGNKILVLPEEVARAAMIARNSEDQIVSNFQYDNKSVLSYGITYDIVEKSDFAEDEAKLESLSVGTFDDFTITADKITGTIPYSLTIDEDKLAAGKAVFATYDLSKYARAYASTDGNDDAQAPIYSNGDVNGDGVSEARDDTNHGFVFVRGDNHKVKVYRADASSTAEINTFLVRAENRLTSPAKYSYTEYAFELTYADPCADPDILSFSLAGQISSSISGRNITVNVPYGTDVKGLVATFTTATGAKVELNAYGSEDLLKSGVTSVNYSAPVTLYVTAENGMARVKYTVTVEQGAHFTDINENDWFYDNVMDAANNGYVTGMGDGTFNPKGATTRAQFASMIAKALGYTADPDAPSMFPDVADNYWGKAAINYCAQNGIISGYDDTTFQPEKAITRQEAAAILNNAFKLAEKYGISTERFPDNGAIADWAADHVYAAKAAGLMKGDADTGNFRPTSTITRAEAASILMNANRAGLIK